MKFLRKVWDWLVDPRAALWFSGFFLADSLHELGKGNFWSAALSGAAFAVDAWYGLRRVQVTA